MNLSCLKQFSLSLIFAIVFLAGFAPAQEDKKTDKAEQIVQQAVAALGGPAYLNVKTVTGRGLYTPYNNENGAGLPSEFVDMIAWPDRERTEFRSSLGRLIQVNTGETGWLFENKLKTFKDVTPAQAADFKTYIRSTLDNLLRGFWRKEGAALSYAGRREAGLGKRNEVVKLTYKDGFEIEYEFGAKDFLPAKSIHRKLNAEGVLAREEDRFAQFLNVGGVLFPFVIDHFREDKQASRVNYQAVEFNRPLPDELFAKPANAKAVKWNF
jgi:hypothetical protein